MDLMPKVIFALVSSLIVYFSRNFFNYYFDAKKSEAYLSYIMITFFTFFLGSIYFYFLLLILNYLSISYSFSLIFLFLPLLFLLIVICLTLCISLNSFIIYVDSENNIFERTNKNRSFFKDMIIIRHKDALENVLKRELDTETKDYDFKNYRADLLHYQDKDNKYYKEYIFIYGKTSFKRISNKCLSSFKLLLLTVFEISFLNFIFLYNLNTQWPYKYIMNDVTFFTLIILNTVCILASIIFLSKIYREIYQDNIRVKIHIIELIENEIKNKNWKFIS